MKCALFIYWVLNLASVVVAHAADVTGRIVSLATGHGVAYARLSLFRMPDSVLIASAFTDTKGKFTFMGVVAGTYYVTCSHVGYETFSSVTFPVDGMHGMDLDTFSIHPSSEQLGEAVVQSRPSVYAGLGKRIFKVNADLIGSAGSVGDLLRNIPSVQVDVDGNVRLRGGTDLSILIDGKPSALMNSHTRAAVLRQMPASEVERIELITNPSAEYKPDGASGIINIVRKKPKGTGFNGTVTAFVGTRERRNVSASVSYNVGERVSLFASYGIRHDLYEVMTTDERMMNHPDTRNVSQQTTGQARPLSHLARLEMGWRINDRNRLQLNGGVNRSHFIRHDYIYFTEKDAQQYITSQGVRYRYDNEHANQWEAGSTYTHIFDIGQELTADYSYSSSEGLEKNRYSNFSTFGDSKENTDIWQAYYQHLFRMAYHRSWNDKLKLNLGYELDALRADLNYHVQHETDGTFLPDPARTSDFTNYGTIMLFMPLWNTNKARGILCLDSVQS